MLFSVRKLKGMFLSASDGHVGSIEDLYFDDRSMVVRYMVAGIGPALIGKKVLISPAALDELGEDGVVVKHTVESIRNSPDVDTRKPISRVMEQKVHGYFGWPYYWNYPSYSSYEGYPQAPQSEVVNPQINGLKEEYDKEAQKTHLRSAKEVIGYQFFARGERVGKLDDFLFDDSDWVLRYCLVELGGGLRHSVLVPVGCVKDIDYFRREVLCEVDPERIRTAPVMDEAVLDREFEKTLLRHYERV